MKQKSGKPLARNPAFVPGPVWGRAPGKTRLNVTQGKANRARFFVLSRFRNRGILPQSVERFHSVASLTRVDSFETFLNGGGASGLAGAWARTLTAAETAALRCHYCGALAVYCRSTSTVLSRAMAVTCGVTSQSMVGGSSFRACG